MDGAPSALAMNPLIAGQNPDTLYAVACVLEVLQKPPSTRTHHALPALDALGAGYGPKSAVVWSETSDE